MSPNLAINLSENILSKISLVWTAAMFSKDRARNETAGGHGQFATSLNTAIKRWIVLVVSTQLESKISRNLRQVDKWQKQNP